MRKFIYLLLFLFTIQISGIGQNIHPILSEYFQGSGPNAPRINLDKVYVKFDPMTSETAKLRIISGVEGIKANSDISTVFGTGEALIEVEAQTEAELHNLIKRLEDVPEIAWAHPVYDYQGLPASYSNRTMVLLKNESQYAILHSVATQYGAAIEKRNEFETLLIQVVVPKGSTIDPLSFAQVLKELNLFEIVEPDFLLSVTLLSVNDPHYAQQWALNNTGSNVPAGGATLDSDMNVEEAWTLRILN